MTNNFYWSQLSKIQVFFPPIFAILLFSFSNASQANIINTTKPVRDTSPAITSIKTNETVQASHVSADPDIIEASFPGGKAAWTLHLIKGLRYPFEAQQQKIQGMVAVQFTVDEKGRVKNIEAVTGDPKLQDEAKRIIRISGRWIPATQHGKPVSSVKEQRIIFRLEPGQEVRREIEKPLPGSDTSASTLEKVEIESSFPGGQGAWLRYLSQTFRYPREAYQNEIQGTVIAQFIVGKDGKVSSIEAVSGPTEGGLREEVVRIIRRSGKWIPAIKDGVPVRSFKKQPITFRLEPQQ